MVKVALAGLAATILYKLQMTTGGRCGGFRLYSRLWRVYTDGYKIQRTGNVWRDLVEPRLRGEV